MLSPPELTLLIDPQTIKNLLFLHKQTAFFAFTRDGILQNIKPSKKSPNHQLMSEQISKI
jgi:hypothetical protein